MTWGNRSKHKEDQTQELFESSLYNEDTFYDQFIIDLLKASDQVIIESPYITIKRLKSLQPIFTYLKSKSVSILIITRDPKEHDNPMALQSERGIRWFENMGIQVLLESGGHHRKLSIIDKKIFYEGSLNILSQAQSREFMRKIVSKKLTNELIQFLQYDKLFI